MPDISQPGASSSGASQLQEAIAAIKAGDKAKGRKLLALFLQTNPTHENALLWISATTKDPDEKRKLFKRVLQVNPNNEKAKQALAKLDAVDEEPPLEALTGSPAKPAKIRRLSTGTVPAQPAKSKPKSSSNAALWVTLLIIIACCPIFALASLISSENRPPATTPPTEAPDTAVPEPTAIPENETYLTEVKTGVDGIREGVSQLAEAMDEFEITGNKDTVIRMAASLGYIRGNHEILIEITPPRQFRQFHSDLTSATRGCYEATEQYASAIDNVDIEQLQVAIDLLIVCQREMERISSELEDME